MTRSEQQALDQALALSLQDIPRDVGPQSPESIEQDGITAASSRPIRRAKVKPPTGKENTVEHLSRDTPATTGQDAVKRPSNGRKRKASSATNTTTPGKRRKSMKPDATKSIVATSTIPPDSPITTSETKSAAASKARKPARASRSRKKGATCSDCHQLKRKCYHTSPADDSVERVQSHESARARAIATSSRRGKRVVAQADTDTAMGSSVVGTLAHPSETPSEATASPASSQLTQQSPASSEVAADVPEHEADVNTPPSSISGDDCLFTSWDAADQAESVAKVPDETSASTPESSAFAHPESQAEASEQAPVGDHSTAPTSKLSNIPSDLGVTNAAQQLEISPAIEDAVVAVEDVIFEDTSHVVANPSSADEPTSGRSRRAVKPVQRFGQLVATTDSIQELGVPGEDVKMAATDTAEHPSLQESPAAMAAAQKRSETVKRSWDTRRRNVRAKTAGNAERNTEDVTIPRNEAALESIPTMAAAQKRAAKSKKGWETRRLKAQAKAALSATQTPNADTAPLTAPRIFAKLRVRVDAVTTRPEPKRPGLMLKIVQDQMALSAPTSPSGPKSRQPREVSEPAEDNVVTLAQPAAGMLTSEHSSSASSSDLQTGLSPELIALSKKLEAREPLGSKPAPRGQPEVWADSRQALCETVPYFKMPQSGCHANDGHVYAFLFDNVGHCREYMDSDVIIARAGGGMEVDSTGNMVQKKDHLMGESQVKAVKNDIDHKNPLIIICGDRNGGAITKMPHKYNVLGWYKPIAVWGEKTIGKGGKIWTTIKYRFERLHRSRPPWHQSTTPLYSDEDRKMAGKLVNRVCPTCASHHPHMYLCGWMCLNPNCDDFWRLDHGEDAPYDKMPYNPAFLLNRTIWPDGEEEPHSVKPTVLNVGNIVGDNLTHINTRGICCPHCGRCSSRRLFKGWRCDNPTCTYDNFPKHISVTPPMLHSPWEQTGEGPPLARNKHERSQGIKVDVKYVHGYKVYTYTMDGIDGRFVHAVSNARINRQPRGPDDMFAAMQKQDEPGMDMHLERRRFGAEKMPINIASAVEGEQELPSTAISNVKNVSKPSPLSLSSNQKTDGKVVSQPAEDAPTGPASQRGPASSLLDSTQTDTSISQDSTSGSIEKAAQEPREPQPTPVTHDGDLMTAFSINYGMPYKFVAVGASLPFDGSPWPVRTCRADLNWASQTFLDPADHSDFNEELIFAYLEGQKIEYHDDGESGLGPRIATLSLGGKAKMHLRMKSKHYVGCSKGTGILTQEKPIPNSLDYDRRLAAWTELQQLKTTDAAQYTRRRKEIPKELGIYGKRTKKADDIVTVTLNHGDIVLMEGYDIQQFLEHKVVPEGVLRFALTCRTVLEDHLKPEERPAYDVGSDEVTMGMNWERVQREADIVSG